MVTEKQFAQFCRRNRSGIRKTLIALKKDICDDYRIDDDDTLPGIQITVSASKDLSTWSYQTGDNSFTGSCYGDPYWGVDYLYRRSNSKQLTEDLLNSLAEVIDFE